MGQERQVSSLPLWLGRRNELFLTDEIFEHYINNPAVPKKVVFVLVGLNLSQVLHL